MTDNDVVVDVTDTAIAWSRRKRSRSLTDEQIAIRLGIIPEPPKPPPPPPPRPDATAIRRWMPDDFDSWMYERIEERWPGMRSEIGWRTYLGNLSASNDYLFITNGRNVLLARVFRDVITNRPEIIERFAWSRDARIEKNRGINWIIDPEHEDDFFVLYRHCKAW